MLNPTKKKEADKIIQAVRKLDNTNLALVSAAVQNLLARQQMDEKETRQQINGPAA